MKKTLLLSILTLALTLPIFVSLDSVVAGQECTCGQVRTRTFTKVGATCLKARTKARDAARAAAVCPPEEPSCGPVSHTISTCSRLPNGGFQASAYATFYCNICIDVPDF